MQFHLIVNNIPAESAIFIAKNANEVFKLLVKPLFPPSMLDTRRASAIEHPQPSSSILQAGFKIRQKATFSSLDA